MKIDYAPTDFDKRCIRWFVDHMKPVWQGTRGVGHSSSGLERENPVAVRLFAGLMYAGVAIGVIWALASGQWTPLEEFLRTPVWFQWLSGGVILLVAGVLLLGAALWLLALLGFTPATFIIAVLLLLILLRLS